MNYIDAKQLKTWIHDTQEIAVLDVREHGQYGESHLFFAVSLPYSILELRARRLVPRLRTRIVAYGNQADSQTVLAAAQALQRLGYENIHILDGGIEAWQAASFPVFAGVNLPSKTFGELAEHVYETPSVSAQQLHAMLNDPSSKLIVLDGRPVPEYRKMNIPGAICCPNGELALRASQLAADPDTTIVINCAGRTRSIVGAQTLINLGLPNKIYALENGTQGWYLADYQLEHQSDRLYPDQIDPSTLPALREKAAALIQRFNLATCSFDQLASWLQHTDSSTFVCDIRTGEEHAASKLPSLVQHTPGGQLIQATDEYIGVRKARIVLLDYDQIRAPVVASWLKQLGWQVHLLPATDQVAALPDIAEPVFGLRHTRDLSTADAVAFIKANPAASIIDTRPSMTFRTQHLKHATWAIRPTLAQHVPENRRTPILLLGTEPAKLKVLASDLENTGYLDIQIAIADQAFFETCGLPTASDSNNPPDAQCIDFLFFVHDRHSGNKDAARKYLEWETNLVSQIDELERNTFSFG